LDSSELSFKELVGMRTIILGDVGTGKTALTRRLLTEALEEADMHVTALDFAPPVKVLSGVQVGGFLVEAEHPRLRHLKSSLIETPRLSARSGDELIRLAEHNRQITEAMLREFTRSPTEALFVNDASIYLQRGEIDRLWRAFEAAETVVANGYYGEKLKADYGTGLSSREKTLMEELASKMDEVIRL